MAVIYKKIQKISEGQWKWQKTHAQNKPFFYSPTEHSSFITQKPPSARTFCSSCGAHGTRKRYALYK